MIKLNNKNITYVALADSNNSLKAPKEVWYADSSNSVKLVYRRKDALIEGEDYEKYHWLIGDGTAFINTLQPVEPDDELICSIIPVAANLSNWQYVYGNYPGDNAYTFMCVLMTSNRLHFRHKRGITNYSVNTRYNIVHSINSVEVNGDSIPYSTEDVYVENDRALVLFNAQEYNNNYIFDGYISNVILSSKLNLIPCKLLKPVPKWLDANGIRRQVGECGMIDLVSGKFYGNVANAGTFSVENYYERKEWLVGDGTAYIDTGHNVNEDLDYETKVHLLPNTYLFWYRSGNPYIDQTMVVRSNTSTYQGSRIAKNSTDVRIGDTANVEVQWNNNKVSINGVDYIPNDGAVTFNYELYLFYAYLADTAMTTHSSNNVKCSYFRFLDSNRNYIQNLIPCTLTMDLPASMDANNIARVKGTSGMWDLVSDRFYGNVASSGTFKAVNLAEGVDYEVHQWLKGDGSAYINTLVSDLTNVNTITCHFYWYGDVSSNNRIFGRESPKSFTCGVDFSVSKLSIWIESPYSQLNLNNGEDYFEVDLVNQKISTSLQTSWISPITEIIGTSFYLFGDHGYNRIFSGKIKSFVIGDKLNLIPVKLLKSIPSKYDANGIARQAGECGMYDTVNDVFYGNVASSGTFSVSDDS